MNTTQTRRLIALAGLAAIAASASALSVDPQITVDRALNSPTLAVRYAGATATLVELRINGESVGTREVSGARRGGETNFTIDLDALRDGDNLVEVRLFDRTGKLVGADKTNISTFKGASRGPVFVSSPKAGSSVLGPVEINVGFGEKLGRSYVSFFVDGQFKSITNYPPFTFVWDTEKETNGWHDIEAWAIDERNETHKTGAVRLFVNNPGGRTNRPGVPTAAIAPTRNAARDLALVGAEAGVRAIGVSTAALGVKGAPLAGRMPSRLPVARTPLARLPVARVAQALPAATVGAMVPIANSVRASVSGANSVRAVVVADAVATGPKSLMPTGRRLALPAGPGLALAAKTPAKAATVAAVRVAAATTRIAVGFGTRLPNLGAYTILMDGMRVRFDVPTRVDDGLPLAPLRSLIEKAGGKVEWVAASKTVRAGAAGHTFELKIGDAAARVDGGNLVLEKAPGLTRGRTIVPLSFLRDALGMEVKYDKATGNVLVSTKG